MKIAVIGAGVTGLSCAHRLHKKGHEVLVLERSPQSGGVLRTCHRDGYIVEHGPNSLMIDAKDLVEFFDELGLSEQVVEGNPDSRNRYILRDSQLVALPLSPPGLITTRAFSLLGKLRILKEFFIPQTKQPENLSVASFFQQRFGLEVFKYAADPFISGIYAGDPEKLSFQYAFPRLLKLEQEHGSILRGLIKLKKTKRKDPDNLPRKLINFKQGMASLTDAMVQKMRTENVRTNIKLHSIARSEKGWELSWSEKDNQKTDTFERLVVTTPAHCLSSLPFPEPLRSTLNPLEEIPHPPIACVALGYRRTQIKHPLDGFGMLIPANEGKNLLGTIFASTLFPGRAPDGHVLLHCFIGGARNTAIGKLEPQDLLELLGPELERILGIHGPPVFLDVKKWDRSIPQCNLGHGRFLEILEKVERSNDGLVFAGSYRTGVAVGQCIREGWNTADKILLNS